MSRVVAGASLMVLGGTAAVAGGIYLPGLLQQSSNNTFPLTPDAVEITQDLSSSDFDSTVRSQPCINTLFPTLQPRGNDLQALSVSEINENFFGTTNGSSTTGCLVVNWSKEHHSNKSKWKGSAKFLWAAKAANKGFLVFLFGKTSTAKDIQWQWMVYVMEEENGSGSGGVWKVKKAGSLINGASSDANNKKFQKGAGDDAAQNKFPHPGTALKTKDNKAVGDFWGWFGTMSDLDNICGSEECEDSAETETFRGYWDWSGSYNASPQAGQAKLSDWTKNLESWWQEIWGASNQKIKNLSDKQVGTWTNRLS